MAAEKMIEVVVAKKKGFVKRSTIGADGVKVPVVYGPGETFEVPASEMNRLGNHGSIITVEQDQKNKQAEFDAADADLERLRLNLTKSAPKGVKTLPKSTATAKD